ncbi:hepatitis A virus cellular receptor 2 [Protobothrops mucrosquamatus]|uniref:hepatitis A virus cellular receptor 2 n=1 Tax=Protobothrops mucrosquamatus TaxID=103944 RepID=UPI0007756C93|nr:hepatitis A virus cellular receptor 2 [Protobothrops mucrosquamatus]
MCSCLLLKQILLVVLTGSFTSYAETVIQGKVGENITLPCHYSVKDHGLTDTCWGRSCPLVGSCPNKMISINENLEIDGQLEKFHLLGNVSQGDVSLTIVNITKDDMGTYCCRMEYQGLFNDDKIFFKLLIEEASLHTTPIYFSTSNFVSKPKWVFITESPVNNISLPMSTMVKKQGKNPRYRIGLYIGIGACAIIFIIIILLIIKWYLHKKQKTINSASQVAFSNSAARGVQNVLNADVHAPENIYHCS